MRTRTWRTPHTTPRRTAWVAAGLLALGGCALGGCAPAAPRAAPLVGSWHLLWLDAPGPDGAMRRTSDARGSLIYTPTGQVSVQVMYPTAGSAPSGGPVQYVEGGYEGTFGRYVVDEATRTVTHRYDGANVRSLIAQDLPRRYEITGSRLVLRSTRPDERWSVTWEREGGPSAPPDATSGTARVARAASRAGSSSGPPQGMLVRMSELQIEPTQRQAYDAILQEEAEASVRLEPGVIAIVPMSHREDPTEVRILEIYASRAAYESHLQTPHFQKYKTTTLSMVKSLKLVDMGLIDPATMPGIFAKMQGGK